MTSAWLWYSPWLDSHMMKMWMQQSSCSQVNDFILFLVKFHSKSTVIRLWPYIHMNFHFYWGWCVTALSIPNWDSITSTTTARKPQGSPHTGCSLWRILSRERAKVWVFKPPLSALAGSCANRVEWHIRNSAVILLIPKILLRGEGTRSIGFGICYEDWVDILYW
jgi:hypothetical protein